MSIIIPANTLAAGGYDVDNGIRFDGSSSYMTLTPGSAGSQKIVTFSTWIKRSQIGEGAGPADVFMMYGYAGSNSDTRLYFTGDGNAADDRLYFQSTTSNTTHTALATNRKFRDPNAWYHIVINYNSSVSSPDTNHVEMFINGVKETSFVTETYPSQNDVVYWTDDSLHTIARRSDGGNLWYGGYMAETVMIDGQALDADSFGEFDEDSGIWKPIDVSGLTFGTNGFYLEYKGSGTSANSSGLGADTSGNDHHFAVSGLAATDQTTDTCTNNFCTINSLDNLYAAATLAEGNLKVTCSAGNTSFITSTFGLTKGKWYWEAKLTTVGGEEAIGITDIVSTATDNYAGQTANSYSFKGNNGNIRNADENESYGSAYGTSVIGVYMDLDNNKLYFAINGTIQASGAGFDITAAASTTNGFYFPMVGDVDSDSPVWEVNFGNPVSALSSAVSDANGFGSFEYSPSDGGSASFDSAVKSFLAICTKNLAESG